MGIYETNCPKCGKSFMWWSGNRCQYCSECIDKMGGSIFEIERKFKNPTDSVVGRFYFI